MLLFCLAGYIGVGWLVRKPIPWLLGFFGEERCFEVHSAYLRMLGRLFPADGDSDGFPDMAERYMGSNPHDPNYRPDLVILGDNVAGFELGIVLPEQMQKVGGAYLLAPGERRRIRIRVGITGMEYGRTAVFSPGMRLLTKVDPPGRPCLPGQPPSDGPLWVPVAVDGTMEFDLFIPSDAKVTSFASALDTLSPPSIDAENPLSGTGVYPGAFIVGWRLPPIPCTAVEVPLDDPVRAQLWVPYQKLMLARIAWQPIDRSGLFLIEATCDESGREWFPIGICPAEDRSCLVTGAMALTGYRGPLKFRVVPTRPAPENSPGH
jgi:hypothetical protein